MEIMSHFTSFENLDNFDLADQDFSSYSKSRNNYKQLWVILFYF